MSRSQRILQYVAAAKRPVTLADIIAAIAVHEPRVEEKARFNVTVSAYLSQAISDKKLIRHGVPRHYTYTATSLAVLDLRRVDRNGAPKERSKLRAKAAAKPATRTAVKPTAAQQPTARTRTQRLALANLGKPAPRKPGERETVAEFLARGGRIQKLAHGESSQPAYVDVRAQDLRAMRTRLQKALDTDPANTSDADVAAA